MNQIQKKRSKAFVKRQYFDSRIGMVVIAPILSVSNFILLFYNFTEFKDKIPIEYFTIIFIIIIVFVIVSIGKIFRKVQLSTDAALHYENNIQQAKTDLIILKMLGMMHRNQLTPEIDERIKYLTKIIDVKNE
jgi:hypothetical protein